MHALLFTAPKIVIYDQICHALLEEDDYLQQNLTQLCLFFFLLHLQREFRLKLFLLRVLFFFFQADVRPQTDGCNGLRYNLTSDIIESIFRTYPAGKNCALHYKYIHLRFVYYHFTPGRLHCKPEPVSIKDCIFSLFG